jgi:hypothetical protein
MATVKRRVVPLALAISALGLTFLAQVAGASHPRPKGAKPIRASLVPAYDQCAVPNRTHGPPLAFASCNPPVESSSFVTVGTPDANGAPANFVGSLKLTANYGVPGPPDDAYVEFTASLSDVRCKPGTSTCGDANAAGGPDYTGELQGGATIRITDHNNAVAPGGGVDPATVVDVPFPVNLSCASTAATGTGSVCNLSTATCLGCVTEVKDAKRMVIEVTQLRIFDGGADGLVATTPNTLFAVQGIFVP